MSELASAGIRVIAVAVLLFGGALAIGLGRYRPGFPADPKAAGRFGAVYWRWLVAMGTLVAAGGVVLIVLPAASARAVVGGLSAATVIVALAATVHLFRLRRV